MSYFSQTWWYLLCNPSTWKAKAGLSLAWATQQDTVSKNFLNCCQQRQLMVNPVFHQFASFLKTDTDGEVGSSTHKLYNHWRKTSQHGKQSTSCLPLSPSPQFSREID